jgi:transcriptional regulator with XRE-family HTH domain
MSAAAPYAVIGAQVRAARLAAGLTQSEMAAKMGTRPSAISRLEAGRHAATLRTLTAVAALIDTTLTIVPPAEEPTAAEA